MPGERHVFDSLLAAILNQREREGVLAGAAQLVDTRAVAAFGGFAARLLDGDGIRGYCKIAPNVAGGSDDIGGVVSFHRPNSAERFCPGPHQCALTGGTLSTSCP